MDEFYHQTNGCKGNARLNSIDECLFMMNFMKTGIGKYFLDDGITLLWANDSFYAMTGYEKDEFIKNYKNMGEYFLKYPKEYEKLRHSFLAAWKKKEKVCTTLCRLPLKDGGFSWIRMNGFITEESVQGRRIVYCAYENVDEVIALREEQSKLRGKLKEAALVKSSFFSRMSHDIRTPLNAIVGMAQLAYEYSGDPAKVKTYLEKIKSSSHVLLDLFDGILDMSEIEDGRLTAQRKPFELGELIQRITAIFFVLAQEKQVSFQLNTQLRFPLYYYGDEIKINRILVSVLDNAVKYTEPGGNVWLTVICKQGQDGKEELCCLIRDTGVGIEQNKISKIFEPFERGGEGEERLGLGLAIAYRYALLLGGTIEAESGLGRGSDFSIRLPLERVADLYPGEKARENQAGKKEFLGRRILLIEDNAINQEIAQSLLEMRGFHVTVADDGQAGVLKFTDSVEGYYDAVLMDIQMPVMNGLEAAREIRELHRADVATVPIIAMSANALSEDIEKALAAGMDTYIAKPFEIEDLVKILRESCLSI